MCPDTTRRVQFNNYSRKKSDPINMTIAQAFGRSITPEIQKCLSSLLDLFSISAEELFIQWQSFSYTKCKAESLESVELTPASIAELQQYILKNLEKKFSAPELTKKTRRLTAGFEIPSTPSKRKLIEPQSARKTPRTSLALPTFREMSETASSPVADITEVSMINDEVISVLNPEIPESIGMTLENGGKPLLATNFDIQKYHFRTMRQNVLEAADVLDDQIDSHASYLAESYPELSSLIGNPNIISQEDIIAVGRITPDSAALDDPLNKDSLCLEPSRAMGIGQRVKLNLSHIKDYLFFPGQIVALKGRNANGSFFTVNEVIATPLLGAPTSTEEEIREYDTALGGKELKLVVVLGPYTTNDSLDYTVLSDLVEKINNEINPHTVIMFGPFLDYSHPKIVDGSVDEVIDGLLGNKIRVKTLNDVFKFVVAPILKNINPQTQVILVPSTRDVMSTHPSYPQDAFDRKELGLPKNFKCFPNPASFSVNECLFGVSNNDIFKDLKDVAEGGANSENRFDRVAKYVLEQRRYYPQFPGSVSHQKVKLISPPPESADSKISEMEHKAAPRAFEIQQVGGSDLNVPYLGLSEFTDATPDMLIIPSQLKLFARVVQNVVVLNPGSLMKGKRSGSYAIVTIKRAIGENGVELTKVDGETDLYLHDIWKRSRVDILGV